jgi:hypothetical protein
MNFGISYPLFPIHYPLVISPMFCVDDALARSASKEVLSFSSLALRANTYNLSGDKFQYGLSENDLW